MKESAFGRILLMRENEMQHPNCRIGSFKIKVRSLKTKPLPENSVQSETFNYMRNDTLKVLTHVFSLAGLS